MSSRGRPFAILLATFAAACGSSPPPPPPPPPPAPTHAPAAPMAMRQELGDIDEAALARTFSGLNDALQTCMEQGRSRLRNVGGDAKAMLRVGEDGRLRYGFLEESDIGDRDTEKCVLDAFARTAWPKPRGGEAEVRHAFSFAEGAERSTEWGGEDPASAIVHAKKVRADLDKCRAGVTGTFKVTAYARLVVAKKPSKKKLAELVAVGVSPPNKEGEQRVECIVTALKELKLVVPNGGERAGVSKLRFSL